MLPKPQRPPAEATSLAGLVDRHQKAIRRYLRALGARPAEADDLVQETFLAAAGEAGVGRDAALERAWLRGIARIVWLRSRRWWAKRREAAVADAIERLWVEHDDADGGDGLVDALRVCLERIAGRPRAALDLHYREGLRWAEVARRVGLKVNGLKTLMQRTRALLKQCIERRQT